MDPIEVDNPIRIRIQEVIAKAIESIDGVDSFHDLRVAPGKNHTKIIFDLVLEPGCRTDRDRILEIVSDAVKQENNTYEIAVNFDNLYI